MITHVQENYAMTPDIILKSFSEKFHLDPLASPGNVNHFAEENWEDLESWKKEWEGLVWVYPPAWGEAGRWLKKLKNHDNGILMIKSSRLSTKGFKKHVKESFSGFIHLDREVTLNYCDLEGEVVGKYKDTLSLFSFGEEAAHLLAKTSIPGKRFFKEDYSSRISNVNSSVTFNLSKDTKQVNPPLSV